MAVNYAAHFNPNKTPQSQPIPGKEMTLNNAKGYTFSVNEMDQVLRFLILGCEGGTYYTGENKLSIENAVNLVRCIKRDTAAVVKLIVDVSVSGRSAKQDAILFALALTCSEAPEKQKPLAYAAISQVCRTGTHIFQFTKFIKELRGWSRGLRSGVAKFYTQKPLDKLEYQLVKYRQRNGFTHKDVMRLSHPATKDLTRNELFKYAVGKSEFKGGEYANFNLINAYEIGKSLDASSYRDVKTMVGMITDSGLPREGVPTPFLSKPEIWEALLEKMPVGAIIRNLGKISALEMTKSNLSSATIKIIGALRNPEAIKYSRVHPLQILTAIKIYTQGRGDKGSLTWSPNARILDALQDAFYLSFDNIEATGLNTMLALDVSGSMGVHKIAGSPLSAREASAAMAMITARTEENHDFIGFTSSGKKYHGGKGKYGGWGYGVSQLAISPTQRLNDVIDYVSRMDFGGTDCALPMIYAEKYKIPVDTFVIYTDNETWAGNIHPKQALDSYRQKMGRDAKLAVVGMTASSFTIADPKDPGMLDCCGFDTATPNLINQFALGFS
jgi:60 kDa SS-A/Ro ribonucleoprotein